MTNTPRVLVLDGLAETETVLRAVLEPRGTRVERCRSFVASEDESPPEVMVVDLDDQTDERSSEFWPDVPRVILSSVPSNSLERRERFLEKPFHYPDLVRVVQSLLEIPTAERRVK